MNFVNEKAMSDNIKYMRTLINAKCFNSKLSGRSVKKKNELKEYQKIVFDVIATEKDPNYKVGI